MTTRYQITVTADTLPELVGALLAAAGHMAQTDVRPLEPLAESPMAASHPDWPETSINAPLPLPPPDYVAAGLTEHQVMKLPPAQYQPQQQPQAAVVDQTPMCPLGHGAMIWKGGGLSRAGKNMPLWGCSNRNCREAIWPDR